MRRFKIASADHRHIPQPQQAARTTNKQVGNGLFARQSAGRGNPQVVAVHLYFPTGRNRVLSLEGSGNQFRRKSHLCQAGAFKLDINHLLLHPPEGNLCDIVARQQFGLELLGIRLEFRIGMPFAGKGEKDAVHIAEIIVHGRRPGSGRQLILDIVHLPAQLVPNLGNLPGIEAILNIHKHKGESRLRDRINLLQLPHRLDRLLDRVGDFLLHLRRAGAGIRCDDQCGLDGEIRKFQAPQLLVGQKSSTNQQDGHHHHHRTFPERKKCWIHRTSF